MSTDTVWERVDDLCVMLAAPAAFEEQEITALALSLAPQLKLLEGRVQTSPPDTILSKGLRALAQAVRDLAHRRLPSAQLARTAAGRTVLDLAPHVERLIQCAGGRAEQFACDQECTGPCCSCLH